MPGSLFRASFRRFQRFLAMIHREAESPQKPVRHLRLMQLEDRRVLNASLGLMAGIELTGGEELLIQDGGLEDVGGGNVQTVDFTVANGTWTVDGGIETNLYDLSGDGKTLTVDQTLIDDGGVVPGTSNELLIQGSDAATDSVTINLTGLDFVPSGGIVFEGGEDAGGLDNDSLTVTGYSLATADGVADVTVTHTGAEAGSVSLAGIGTIAFSEIEPLTLSGTAADLVINLPTGVDDNVVLSDDATTDDGMSQIASPTNTRFETTSFSNPTNSLTIVDGSGAKTISVEGLDSLYSVDLTVNVDSDDTVRFQTNDLALSGGDLSVNAGVITGSVTISTSAATAGSITLIADGDVTTRALQAQGTDSGGDILVQSVSGSIDTGGFEVLANADISMVGSEGGLITLDAASDIAFGSLNSAGESSAGDISIIVDGTASQAAGTITGNGALNKQGSGSLVLSEDNDYTGSTSITAGTVQVTIVGSTDSNTLLTDGVLDVAGEIDGNVVVDGGTVKGTGGTITGMLTVNNGGTLAPGNSPGVISSGDLNLAAGSASEFEIQDTNAAGATAGTDYDQVDVTGTVTIDPTANLTVDTTGSTGVTAGEEYILISNNGTDEVSGTFSGLAEGAIVSTDLGGSGSAGIITYAGGDGNDVAIVATDVTVTIDGSGNLVMNGVGANNDNAFVVTDDGTSITIQDPGKQVTAVDIPGAVQVDANTVSIAKSLFTGEVIVNGNDGEDSLELDFDSGNFSRAVSFNGGAPSSGPGDSLILSGGGTFTTVTHQFNSASSGTVAVAGNNLISYSGLEPVSDTITATTRTFTFTGGAETIEVTDSGGADGMMTIDSTLGESVTFVNPTDQLTINAGTGDDIININGTDDAYRAALTINGDEGADAVTLGTSLDIDQTNSGSGNSFEVTAETISIGPAGTVTIDTTGAANGNVVLNGGVGGITVANSSTITTGDGTITIAGNAGAVDLGDATLTTTSAAAGAVNISDAASINVGTVSAANGSVTLAANGAITDGNAAALNITAGTATLIAVNGIGSGNAIETNIISLNASSIMTGSIDIDETDTITLTNVDTADGAINITAGGAMTAINVTANGVHDILLASGSTLEINGSVSADGDSVRLIGNGDITQGIMGVITANELGVRQEAAIGDIHLCNGNAVDEFAADNMAAGGTISFESTRDLTIGAVTAQMAGTVTFAATTGVITTNGDIFIDGRGTLFLDEAIDAGTADVRLVGLEDITQDAEGIITANELGVRNENGLPAGGNIDLSFANAVDEVAINNAAAGGTAAFRSTRDLTIGEVAEFTDPCGTTFAATTGAATNSGDAKIVSDMSLNIAQAITLGAGNTFLEVADNVTQTDPGTITAAGLGLMVGGTTTLDNTGNNVATLAADNMGSITYRDADTLTINSVTVDGMPVAGISTTNDDVTINVLAGNLNIQQMVNTQGGNVIANAASDITSTVPGAITTTGTMASQDSGTVQVAGGRNVSLAGAVDTSGFDNAGGNDNSDGGNVTVTATVGSIGMDDVTTSGGDVANGTGGNAGTITIDAGTTITFNDNPAVADPADGDISSAGGQNLNTGIRTGNGADLTIPDAVIIAASDVDGEVQTINTSGATAGDVTFQSTADGATDNVNDLVIDARDTEVANLASQTSGDVVFLRDVGVTTRLGDLTITDADDFTAMGLIRATSLTQKAGTGDTTLNDVNIETVIPGPSSGVDITTDYTVNLRGNISVSDDTMTVDNTAATGETIAITSVDGNVIIEDGVIVSTDEDSAAGHSSEFTGDALTITADSAAIARRTYMAADRDSDADGTNDAMDTDLDGDGTLDIDPTDTDVPVKGLFKAGPNTELRTDAGVAKRFPPLIDPPGLITATSLNETTDQVNFRSEWDVAIGVAGEENLRVNIDWRDPNDDPDTFADTATDNPVTSSREQTFLVRDEADGVNPATESIGHVYSNQDFVDFVKSEVTNFEVDFSVSHHESIVVNGTSLDQSPLSGPEVVTGGVITTTDNPNTGTGTADPGTDVTDSIDSNSDLHYETGLFEVRIPTEIGFVAPPDPERPVPVPDPAAIPPATDSEPQQFVPSEVIDSLTTSYSSQSEDYFQLRQNSTDPVEGFEHIGSDIGWKLLQPRRLKEWVYANDLDGSGYELWLITTKVKDGQDITFERPVLKFDVFDNQPFPESEELLDQLPELKLERLHFDEEGNLIETPAESEKDDGIDGNNVNGEGLDTSMQQQTSPPGNPEAPSVSSVDGSANGVVRSAMTGLAVSTLLNRNQRQHAKPRHLSTVSHILNRIKQ